jgi:hypothetical protein
MAEAVVCRIPIDESTGRACPCRQRQSLDITGGTPQVGAR